MAKLEIKGLDELQKKLKDNVTLNDVKKVVRKNGAELTEKMIDKADFRGHMEGKKFVSATGTTKRSIGLTISDGGMTVEVGPETEYAEYPEYGTRFMDAQPFVKPALNAQKQKFKNDINKLMK